MNGVRQLDGRPIIFCPSCGEVHDEATALAAEWKEDVTNIEHDLRGKRSRIKMLAGDSEYKALHSPRYEPAMRVLKRWRELLAPKTKDLHGKRLINCVGRLKDYSEDDLNHSVDGYVRFPFIVERRRSPMGNSTDWAADAEFIFRSAKNVEQGWRLAAPQMVPVPDALLARIPWRRIRELNRRTIIAFLTERYGAPFEDGYFLHSPCPRCDDGRGTSSPLRITIGDASWLAECSRCGLAEQQLLGMVTRGAPRESVAPVQMELRLA